ncbi:hypothetical protein E3P99_00235 [Wallemia hederae]|uniref:Sister chromatid cohesion protein n=1 Tax=Wallemia hederae TaxID=1540922 RepID=A0A4T0FWI2_9BASI|nr:hypothetical protein E3P99_00235 [Wallemia hederae]
MTLAKLKFKEKIVQQGLQTNELLRRLQTLHKELSEWDQDAIDANSLHKVAKQLLDKSLLLHKDKLVKALVAASFIDILRLCAPDAPYTLNELKDVFSFMFRQVAYLWKPPKDAKQTDVQCYKEYYYILRTMADVSCVVLVCDLPNAEDIISAIFKDFLDGIRDDTAPRLQGFMADIMAQLIDETNSIPTNILEPLLISFTDKTAKMNSSKHKLVVEVCNKTSERLQKSVCQYFSEILLKVTDDEYSEKEYDEAVEAHKIIRSIHKHSPRILLSTIPLLEVELHSENSDIRELGTRTLGRMLGEPSSDPKYSSLSKEHPNAFRTWIDRKKDLVASVRSLIVEYAPAVILTQPLLTSEIIATVTDKLRDFDDKVRAVACQFFQKITYEVALSYTPKSSLDELTLRCKDKKAAVRQDAFESLGRLYTMAYADIKINNGTAVEKFGWIPRAVLVPLNIALPGQTASIKLQVERTLVKHILPLHAESDAAWVDRFLRVYATLGEDEKNALLNLTGLQKSAHRSYAYRYVEACENFASDRSNDNKEKVVTFIKALGSLFPEDSKATSDLQEFVKLNESRLYKCLKTAMNPQQCDFKTLQKCQSELHRRLEQLAGQRKTLAGTFDALLLKVTYPLVNKTSIPHLLKRSAEDNSSASEVLHAIAKHAPTMLKSHMSELMKNVSDEPELAQENEIALLLLAAVSRADNSSAPSDKRSLDRLLKFVDRGTRKQVKSATRVLSCSENGKQILSKIARQINLQNDVIDEEKLMRNLTCLAEISKSAFHIIQVDIQSLVDAILMLVLVQGHTNFDRYQQATVDVDLEWTDDNESIDHLTFAKIEAMRLLTYVARAKYDNTDQELDTAKKVVNTLAHVVRKKGEVSTVEFDDDGDAPIVEVKNEDESFETPAFIRSRLRLKALTCLVKIAQDEKLEKEYVRRYFLLMSGGVQDAAYSIRKEYITRLIQCLAPLKLPYHYNVFMFLAAHEPEPENIGKVQIYVRSMFHLSGHLSSDLLLTFAQEIRLNAFEMIFYRLLHALAHHPDFSPHPTDIEATAKYVVAWHRLSNSHLFTRYISFYLDLVATAENINLLYHLAGKLKTVRDITTKNNSVNLYILSELGQHLTSELARSRKWTLAAYEGKVKLSTDIFKALPNSNVQREISEKVYLSEEMKSQLGSTSKPKPAPRRKKLADGGNTTRKPVKRARKKHNWEDNKDESEANSSDNASDNDSDAEDYERRRGPTRKARPQPRPAARKTQVDSDEEMSEAEENDENNAVAVEA